VAEKVTNKEIVQKDLTVDQVQNLPIHQEAHPDQIEEENTEDLTEIERDHIVAVDQEALVVTER
jgi:hypothetical protein